MSVAGFAQVLQVCPKQNLQNFEVSSKRLRSRSKACSLMGFAGLQVCFRSERAVALRISTQWNKTAGMWKTCGLFHTYEYQNAPARLGMLQNSRPRVGASQNPLTLQKIRRVL
jgi:hypothetical protein